MNWSHGVASLIKVTYNTDGSTKCMRGKVGRELGFYDAGVSMRAGYAAAFSQAIGSDEKK